METWAAYVAALVGGADDSSSTVTPTSTTSTTWLSHAQKEICAQFSRLASLASHSDARVQRALLNVVERITATSKSTGLLRLDAGLTATLNSLVVLALAQVPAIQKKSSTILEALIDQSTTATMAKTTENDDASCGFVEGEVATPMVIAISTEANRQLFELSRQLGQQLLFETSKLEQTLLLLTGYLRLLPRLEAIHSDASSPAVVVTTTFFLSRVHLRTLVQNLIRVSELASDGGSVMAGQLGDFNAVEFLFSPELYLAANGRPAKTFRYLTTSRLAALVSDIAALLGAAHLYVIADYLLEGIRELGNCLQHLVIALRLCQIWIFLFKQCCGSGSAWIRNFCLDPDPDPAKSERAYK